ncbi:MAG: hypothetical protein QOE84_3280 [Actinomycetota bacterium]|jgi:hypothetical protein|nr:hypothetical protein [Actinomycetota bacterium]
MTTGNSNRPAVAGPLGPTPGRAPWSVRRTSSLDMTWVDGFRSQMRIVGRARDLLTRSRLDDTVVLAEDVLHVGVAPDRTIEEIRSDPERPELSRLVGARGGGRLRGVLAEVVPTELREATPLYLLLDDLSGATLVAGFAFSQWPDLVEQLRRPSGPMSRPPARRMEGICTGFQPGSSALNTDGTSRWTHDVQPVPPLRNAADPVGWHEVVETAEVAMRRARRIDVRLDGVLRVDAMFQDSATTPAGHRIAVHEYGLTATMDPGTGELLTVHADPRVLPYQECPLAVLNVDRMVGTVAKDLRISVLEQLKGIAGCTHLNDAVRALAEVPAFAAPLRAGAVTPS